MNLTEAPSLDVLASLPPWVSLGALIICGLLASPVLLELVKRRHDHRDDERPNPEREPVAWIESTIRDAWRQRDDAQQRADRLQRELDAEERRANALERRVSDLELQLDRATRRTP